MTITAQFYTMLAMIGMGTFFGAAFDTYNRFLKRAKRKNWIVFCNDILFWLVQALIIFYVLYYVNKGELRFYIFLALLCGFAAYQSLFRKSYLRILEFFIKTVISIYRFLVKVFIYIIYRPVYALIMMIISILITLGRALLSLSKVAWRILLFLLKLIWAPFKWVLTKIWKLVPEKSRKKFTKLYGRFAGIIKKVKNYLRTTLFFNKKNGK